MRRRGTKELFEYWNRLRGLRAAPDRSDVELATLKHLLNTTMMLEVDAGETFPVRVSCHGLNVLFACEQRACSFAALFAPDDRPELRALLRACHSGFHPIVAGVAATSEVGDLAFFEAVLLPLGHGADAGARILAALEPVDVKEWFGKIKAACLRLSSARFLDAPTAARPPSVPHGLAARPIHGFTPAGSLRPGV
ncbi:hypothetical protein M2323_001270 [Rhodoblastus acidophilus]|uniref:PAS domain-containing protein n=1 Tax=Rhodoblastus acidophilus TaxID=1074 RepID=UPI002224FAA9|nr:PAS domain-containing protein [Rhodoblastus acidophilus]MCW2283498.1 hypothetical protein [Rhodoblastus acidophilus]MCW2332358.1 hypothetical protein [Rhodoblastus acidophilus]